MKLYDWSNDDGVLIVVARNLVEARDSAYDAIFDASIAWHYKNSDCNANLKHKRAKAEADRVSKKILCNSPTVHDGPIGFYKSEAN